MTEENDKTLPKDIDSDYSLPGRFEEGSSDYYEPDQVEDKPTNKTILVILAAFVIVSAGFFSYYFLNQDEIDSRIIQNSLTTNPEQKLVNQYGVGEYGSAHAHGAIAVFIDGQPINFALPQFQLSSKYIHFENHNPYLIHRHATNVPLEMLFSSLGITITNDCLVLNSKESSNSSFCTENDKSLVFYVNGEQYYSGISEYVIEHNDRILIYFGDQNNISKYLAYLESLEIYDIPKQRPPFSEDNISV